MLDDVFDFLTNKRVAYLLVGLVLLSEYRRGGLAGFQERVRSLPWKPLLASLGLAAALAATLLGFDARLMAGIDTTRHAAALEAPIAIGGLLGHTGTLWELLALAYAIAWARGSLPWRKLAWGCLLSSLLSGLIIHVIKLLLARARPLTGDGPLAFFNYARLIGDSDFMSFPSGDVAVCAGAVAFLVFSLRARLRFVLLLLPVLTAFSRMHLDKHWPSDTAFAYAAGLAFAGLVASFLRSEPEPAALALGSPAN